MSKKLIFLLLAAVWVAVPSAVASLKYDTLTSADGLSNSSVNCIYQDSTLMMWFGTWDGLNAYNGYGFRTYKFAPDNANTISNNVIRNIVEEAKGILWVATDYGINRIDVENDRIERFYPGYEDNGPTAEQVFSVAAAADGTIFCAATGWGIACYDKALGRLSALNVPQFNSSEIRAVYYGGQNTLLLHTVQEELVRIRYGLSATGSMEVREKVGLFPEGGVKSVFDSRTALYLVTADAEIYRYERRDGELAAVGKFPPPAREIRAVAQYGDDYLLIATGAPDMYVCDMPGRTFHRMSQMPDINILSLCYGSQDILWVGSDGQGVFQVYNDGIQFDKVPNSRIFGDRNCPVRAFYKDRHGNVYVATKGNGICMLHPDGSKGAAWDVSNGLGNNSVYALAEGFGDDLFVGHDGPGLDVLSCATGRISSIKPASGTYFGSVYAIYRDPSDGCVWLGTNGYGLIGLQLAESGGRYEIRRQRVYVNDKKDATSLSNNTVFAIVPAGGGKLWVGTRGGGLNLFDTRSGKFTHYTTSSGDYPISSNDILSLYAGRDSTLWIGTSYGLNRLSPTAGGRGGFPLVYRKGRAAEQHHPRYPGGRLGQPLAQHQQGAGAAESRRQPDNQLLQQRGVAEQRIFRRCLLPFARRQDVLRRRGRVQPVRSPRHPRADVRPGRAAQQFPDQADARVRIPCRPRDRPVAQRKLFQHPVLRAGIHPQRQLRIRLHPQGVQR